MNQFNQKQKAIFCALAFLLLSDFTYSLSGHGIKTVEGNYVYVIPSHLSLAEAKVKAVEYAKLKILADEFGTAVGAVTTTVLSSAGSSSTYETGETEVKGEWLETIGEPDFFVETRNGELLLKVTIKGKVRALQNAGTDIAVKTLKGVNDDRFSTCDFSSGDDLYVSFTSPVSGYVAMFFLCGDTVFRILPYQDDESGCLAVKGNRRYCFFSQNDNSFSELAGKVDELQLFCDTTFENDRIFTVFSTKPFVRTIDKKSGENLPNAIDYKSFQSWLLKNRKLDKEMVVSVSDITVRSSD